MDVGCVLKPGCSIFCQEEKLDRVIIDDIGIFRIADVWVNNQPAKGLKDFDFRLINQSTVLDVNSQNGEVVFINFNPQAVLDLTVVYQQAPFCLQVLPQLTGFGLRLIIERKLNMSEFDILDQGRSAIDEFQTLEPYTKNQLVIKPKDSDIEAKLPGQENNLGLCLVNFVNFNNKVTLAFSSDAPAWRTVDRGFNLEGACKNTSCPSYEKGRVCVEKGYGEFHISEVTCLCQCPGCHQPLISDNIDNCIFLDCLYTITGMTENATELLTIGPFQANKDPISYLRNDDTLIKWKFLKIKVESAKTCQLF